MDRNGLDENIRKGKGNSRNLNGINLCLLSVTNIDKGNGNVVNLN